MDHGHSVDLVVARCWQTTKQRKRAHQRMTKSGKLKAHTEMSLDRVGYDELFCYEIGNGQLHDCPGRAIAEREADIALPERKHDGIDETVALDPFRHILEHPKK